MSQNGPAPYAKLVTTVMEKFLKTYNCEPTVISVAPARVNLIGEHIDYCDGFVMPMVCLIIVY